MGNIYTDLDCPVRTRTYKAAFIPTTQNKRFERNL